MIYRFKKFIKIDQNQRWEISKYWFASLILGDGPWKTLYNYRTSQKKLENMYLKATAKASFMFSGER